MPAKLFTIYAPGRAAEAGDEAGRADEEDVMDIRGFAHPVARRLLTLAVAAVVGMAVALVCSRKGSR